MFVGWWQYVIASSAVILRMALRRRVAARNMSCYGHAISTVGGDYTPSLLGEHYNLPVTPISRLFCCYGGRAARHAYIAGLAAVGRSADEEDSDGAILSR